MLAVSTAIIWKKVPSMVLDIFSLQEKLRNRRYFFGYCYTVWMIDIEKYIKIGYGKSVRKNVLSTLKTYLCRKKKNSALYRHESQIIVCFLV